MLTEEAIGKCHEFKMTEISDMLCINIYTNM